MELHYHYCMLILILYQSLWIINGLNTNSIIRTRKFFASTTRGMESILAKELKTLTNIENIVEGKAGVSFQGDDVTGFEALVYCRTPLKIMEMITESQNIISRDDLYEVCTKVDWSQMIDTQSTLRVDTVLGSIPRRSDLSHTHFSSLTIKNSS